MARRYLLDTSVCVDILRGRVPASGLPMVGACRLSAIVTAELRTGLATMDADRTRSRKLENISANSSKPAPMATWIGWQHTPSAAPIRACCGRGCAR